MKEKKLNPFLSKKSFFVFCLISLTGVLIGGSIKAAVSSTSTPLESPWPQNKVKEDSFFIHWIYVEEDEIEKASEKIVEKFEKYLEVIYG